MNVRVRQSTLTIVKQEKSKTNEKGDSSLYYDFTFFSTIK